MRETFKIRFKSARLQKGYSLADLAKAMNNIVTRQSLHKYEIGKVMPDNEMIIKIANALDKPPNYFLTPVTVKVELGEIKYFKFKTI